MLLRSGKTVQTKNTNTDIGGNLPVDDSNVFGSDSFIKTNLKYLIETDNLIVGTQSGFIRKLKMFMQMFELLHGAIFKTIFYNTTQQYIKLCVLLPQTLIKKCAELDRDINIRIQSEICKGNPFTKTDLRTIKTFLTLLTRTRQKYILIRDNLTLHYP